MMYVLAQVSPGVLGWVWAESRTELNVYTGNWESARAGMGGPGDSLGTEGYL